MVLLTRAGGRRRRGHAEALGQAFPTGALKVAVDLSEMGCIDRRMTEAELLRQRRDSIVKNAPQLLEAVWAKAILLVEEARKKGFVLATDGAGNERIVRRPETETEARLVLDAEREHVLACTGARETWFDIDIGDHAVICLRLGGRQISPEDVAKRLLDPLLIPELARMRE